MSVETYRVFQHTTDIPNCT